MMSGSDPIKRVNALWHPEFDHNWFVACMSRELVKGNTLRVGLFGKPIVLFRDSSGSPGALADVCPHRNMALSAGWVVDGNLVCSYHGWTFDGQGGCMHIPGLQEQKERKNWNAVRYASVEEDGLVWVYGKANASPETTPMRLPGYGERGFTSFTWRVPVPATLPNALENFLDGTHTHFVHAGLIRRHLIRKPVTAMVRRTNHLVEAEYVDEGQQTGIISQLFGADVTTSIGRFLLPSTAQLEYRSPKHAKLFITVFVTPKSESEQVAFATITGRVNPVIGWLAKLVIRGLFGVALRQDMRMMKLQADNINSVGEEKFAFTELDLLRPHINKLLLQDPAEAPSPDILSEKKVVMML